MSSAFTRAPDSDPIPLPEFEQGQVAHQPFPNQEDRRRMSEQATRHPRKRDRNRDWDAVPRGSLATDY